MKGVSELKSRMQGIQDTVKITKAMYLLSASKMPRYNQRLEEARKWMELLETARSATAKVEALAPYYQRREGTVGYLVFGSDKGLCGDYNDKIRTFALAEIGKSQDKRVYALGNMAKDFLKSNGIKSNTSFVHVMLSPTLADAEQIATALLDEYNLGKLAEVVLVYTLSLAQGNQQPIAEALLPLPAVKAEQSLPLSGGEKDGAGILYNYVVGKIYLALLEAAAALNFKRMTTMHTATDNAEEILEEMTLQLNHLRQDGITAELSDVNTAKIAKEDRQ